MLSPNALDLATCLGSAPSAINDGAVKQASFVAAANELQVSQSSLSRIIQSLEEMLGTSLFIRTTRRVELTPPYAASSAAQTPDSGTCRLTHLTSIQSSKPSPRPNTGCVSRRSAPSKTLGDTSATSSRPSNLANAPTTTHRQANDEGNDGHANFPEYQNVYIEPLLTRAYKKTGVFPDGTIFYKDRKAKLDDLMTVGY
jgi:hypothetical protein